MALHLFGIKENEYIVINSETSKEVKEEIKVVVDKIYKCIKDKLKAFM